MLATRHDLLLQENAGTPLGRLRLSGFIAKGRGVLPRRPMRIYGRYAVVCLLKGRGRYEDANHLRRDVRAGDVILIFPELAHIYGPNGRETWDEFYVTFDGPLFDLWRQTGLLDSSQPLRVAPPDWAARLRTIIEDRSANVSPAGQLRQLCAFLSLMAELISPEGEEAQEKGAASEGVAQAKALLDVELGAALDWRDVAKEAGMSYETLRKRFQAEVGQSPARYRARRRIEAARELLRYSPQLTNRQAAEMLGFSDEYHFSRRFTEAVGITPRAFRRKERERMAANQDADKRQDGGTPENILVRPVTTAELPLLWELRGRVLRPGKPPETWRYPEDADATTVHLGAFTPEEALVGILTLLENNGLQLRGMAVAPEAQGQGVGAALLEQAHRVAVERGFDSLWCNARAAAVGFYSRCGWNVESDVFDVPGIGPHYVMRKNPTVR